MFIIHMTCLIESLAMAYEINQSSYKVLALYFENCVNALRQRQTETDHYIFHET